MKPYGAGQRRWYGSTRYRASSQSATLAPMRAAIGASAVTLTSLSLLRTILPPSSSAHCATRRCHCPSQQIFLSIHGTNGRQFKNNHPAATSPARSSGSGQKMSKGRRERQSTKTTRPSPPARLTALNRPGKAELRATRTLIDAEFLVQKRPPLRGVALCPHQRGNALMLMRQQLSTPPRPHVHRLPDCPEAALIPQPYLVDVGPLFSSGCSSESLQE